jgi:hypothetical protein
MYPGAVSQPCVDKRRSIVKTAANRRRKPLGKRPHGTLIWKPDLGQLEAGTTIDEDLTGTIDQDVGHAWLAK